MAQKIDRCRKALSQAIAKSDLTAVQRLRLRLALVRPDVREAVDSYLDEIVTTDAIGDGDLLKLILEHLPEIIEAIKLIISLF